LPEHTAGGSVQKDSDGNHIWDELTRLWFCWPIGWRHTGDEGYGSKVGSRSHSSHVFYWREILTMRRFTSALSIAALCVCFSAMNGCGEDNEAAIKEQMAKSTGSVDSSKAIAPSQSMADYAKNNPGMNPAASSAKGPGVGSKAPTPAKKQ
jgi:hypothetical protein